MRRIKIFCLMILLVSGTVTAKEPAIEDLKNEVCPVMGHQVDPMLWFVYKGKKIHICCPCCEEKFKKDPEKYLAILKQQKKDREALDW